MKSFRQPADLLLSFVSGQKKVNHIDNFILPTFFDIPMRRTFKTKNIFFGYQHFTTLWLAMRIKKTLNKRSSASECL
jgi:hypothetical protein